MATLRDGVMKRGTTWSYVIRVTDPATGKSKPKWAGGFPTEQEAKAARTKLESNLDAVSTSSGAASPSVNT